MPNPIDDLRESVSPKVMKNSHPSHTWESWQQVGPQGPKVNKTYTKPKPQVTCLATSEVEIWDFRKLCKMSNFQFNWVPVEPQIQINRITAWSTTLTNPFTTFTISQSSMRWQSPHNLCHESLTLKKLEIRENEWKWVQWSMTLQWASGLSR